MRRPSLSLVMGVAVLALFTSGWGRTDSRTPPASTKTESRPMDASDKPSACPACGSKESVIPIGYGMPGKEMMDRAERGEILLGGCVVEPNSPRWHCKSCKKSW